MTLGVARRLAYQLEIPIADFLRGVDGASQSFGFAATCSLPRSMRAVHRQGVIDAPVLVKQMELFSDDGVTGNVVPIAKKPLLRMLRKKTGLPKEKLR